MATNEEELEAAIWTAMHECRVSSPLPLKFLELVTLAAQQYAAGDSEILTAMRRRVLHRDGAEQTSPSGCGGVAGAMAELHPPGSAIAGPQGVGDGGATTSTETFIPEPSSRSK